MTEPLELAAQARGAPRGVAVRRFRQIVLWPLQLMPLPGGGPLKRHWDCLAEPGAGQPWHEVPDGFCCDGDDFQERHYAEFVNFLPYVQRVLYGEAPGAAGGPLSASPIRIFRRADIAGLRIALDRDSAPIELQIGQVDLVFFLDVDVVVPVVEFHASDLDLATVQDVMFRFGRAYPPYWDDSGRAGHCPWRVDWLGADGRVLATSDYEQRDKYLRFVARHRAPAIAAHWEWLLAPLVQHHSADPGPVRYRQLEYHRMPTMAWLALDDVDALTRADWVRLGLVTAPGDPTLLPYSRRHLADFEERHCFDRYFEPECGHRWMNTRLMCSGHSFVMVGHAGEPNYTGTGHGLQGQFRHHYFLVFLVSHFQKAALLMLSDRLVEALARLDIHSMQSVKDFKRSIRDTLAIFLGFTHRYWWHEISNQVQVRDLYRMMSGHLGSGQLYAEVRDELKDMSTYLESDQLRRQANTVVRLTVVTTFGLIGTVLSGIFGMNLFDFPGMPLAVQVPLFVVMGVLVTAVLFYTLAKAKRLADFLDAVSDERVPVGAKWGALVAVWRERQQARAARQAGTGAARREEAAS